MATAILDHHHALSKAKIQLMARPDSAFFTTICFSLKHIWDEHIPTACTNGLEIRFNPKFFMSLTVDEQIFLLLHESMHVAYLHMVRLQTRNQPKFNMAADYVINLQLVERHFKMPKEGLLDHQFTGMSTEQVYELLPDSACKNFTMDLVPGDGTQAAEEALTNQIQDILVRAKIQSKMSGDKPGTIPGEIELFIDNLLNPKLPWNRILQKYISAMAKDDYSFRRPNRRFFPRYHLPSLFSERLMDLAVFVDISGSVSDEEFKAQVTEIASIFRMMNPETITVIQFDTELKSVEKVKSIGELMKIKFHGRGGTLIGPTLDWIKTNKPQLSLVLSDGGFNFYDAEGPATPVIWVIYNNPNWTAPFGKVIHYSI